MRLIHKSVGMFLAIHNMINEPHIDQYTISNYLLSISK